MKSPIDWLNVMNSYNGLLTFFTTLILALITGYYAYQTKKQVDTATKIFNNEIEHKLFVKNNLGFLLNSELNLNSHFFVCYSYYYSIADASGVANSRNFLINISNQEWRMSSVEVAKLFSKRIMEELVGYYSGATSIINYSQETFNNEDLYRHSKLQLASTIRCLNLLEEELGLKLRRQETYLVDGKEIGVNEKGDILINNMSK